MNKTVAISFVLYLIFTLPGNTMSKTANKIKENHFDYFDRKGYFLFDEFKSALLSSGEKNKFIEDFLSRIKKGKYPLFENDSSYVLFYKGDEDTVGVLGDMSNWKDILPMEEIGSTGLHFLRGKAEKDARFEYWLMFGKNDFPALDTINPYKGLSGFGQVSELAMPEYKRHPYFDKYIYGQKGGPEGLKEHLLRSEYLGYEHMVHVYLPPDYNENKNKKYPAVYFQDGIDYVEFAQVPEILNGLIKDNKIQPVVAVFVTPPNRLKAGMPNRMTEYGMNDDYVKFFTRELVPFIDANYSTLKDNHMRLVAGDSYGGLISTYIPFSRPDVFANGYSQSGYHSFSKDKMINLILSEDKKDINLYVDTGIYERYVGASFLPADETDFLLANRRLKKALEKKSYKFVYREYPEGHTWGNWKRHLIDALIYFFPDIKRADK